MELRETTRNLIAQVEQTSGFPVVVTQDANLSNISTVSMANQDRLGHLILLNPKAPEGVDYYVTYYCRMIQRFFENSPEERFIFTIGEKGRYQVRKLLDRMPIARMMPANHQSVMCEQLLQGLMTHLRSIPIGMRVDNCIFTEHPNLLEMQKNAIQPQLQDNTRASSEQFRKMFPPPIFDATMAINAAFAQFWAEKWNQPELSLPYKSSGYGLAGEQLLKILNDTPDSGKTDRELIDAWGATLNVTGWYDWMPYKTPQRTS